MGCLRDSRTKNQNSRTKGSQLRSPFFELQEKYFSFELANLTLSQETKKLSSGKILVPGVLIQVRYSRLSFSVADHGHHTVSMSYYWYSVSRCRLLSLSFCFCSRHRSSRNHVTLLELLKMCQKLQYREKSRSKQIKNKHSALSLYPSDA